VNEEGQPGFAEEVAELCALAEIEPGKYVRLAGRSFALPPSRDPPAAMLELLPLLLYENVFCRAAAADYRYPGENLPPPADPDFRRRLLAATAAAGARVSLADQPGFLYLHGAPRDGVWDEGALLRIYFDSPPASALRLAAKLPARLARFRIPFHFKILLQPPELERRCDGVVLYVQRRHFPVAGLLCLEQLESLPAGRRSPLFTLPLAPGLSLAEDPGGSFGMSRCRLLAEILWNCRHGGISEVEVQVAEARRIFVGRGLDPERPYLNPGSAGFYPLPSLAEGP
jgi:hypothetical protein